MRRTIARFLLAGGVVLAGFPAIATEPLPEPQPTAETQKELLAARSKELERRLQRPASVRGSRGPAAAQVVQKNKMRRQQREIEALIRRLEAGENVAPGEVERLLGAR